MGLSIDTIRAKRREMRRKLKDLKNCAPIVNVLCSTVLPLEGASVDLKTQRLTLKQAKSLKAEEVVERYNLLLAACSMQNDAFQHMYKIISFLLQFAAVHNKESSEYEKNLQKIQQKVDKALNQKPTAARRQRKPAATNDADLGDCSDADQADGTLQIFC